MVNGTRWVGHPPRRPHPRITNQPRTRKNAHPLDRALDELARTSHLAPAAQRLRCLRGIDTLSAIGLAAEIRDFARFAHPDQLACYLGLVPSEHTSSDKRRQGAITKAGSSHARRLLVEAAWHYARPPRVSSELARRHN